MTFRPQHLLAALVLHVALMGLLAGGVQCSVKPHTPQVITAVLLDPSRQQVAERKREERRQADLDNQRREADTRRKLEEQKKAEALRRAQAEVEAKKRKDAEALRLKQAADRRKAEEQARADAVRRQAEEQARIEKAMQAEAEQMRAADAARAQAEAARLDRVAEWVAALTAHVTANYRKPPSAPDDFSCRVNMQLLPDGTVTGVKVLKSCGNLLLDRAVEDAVYRSSPMPRPADPSAFQRDLTINFKP